MHSNPAQAVIYLGGSAEEREATEHGLQAAGLAVEWVDSVQAALRALQQRDMPVLLDLSLGAAALQTARELRYERAATLLFAVVDSRRPDLTTEAVLAGMADVFARPLSGRRVLNAIRRERAYEAGGISHTADLRAADDLYSHSPAMRGIGDLMARAAGMRAGVLISGEKGSGRQLVARTIHEVGPQPGAPFTAVDCGMSEPEQLDIAVFGRTGRVAKSNGGRGLGLERISQESLLFRSRGGTLYLQNLADASTRVQSRLAKVLRDREAILTETGETITLDVRPMAGADDGLEASVREGRIRDDLFRRLSVIRLHVPALRHRREDIPALANYFVREACARRGVPPKTLSRPALSLLGALPWRENALELRALVEVVVESLGGGRGIGLEDVLAHVRLDSGAVAGAVSGTLREARARFEREYIAAVLEQNRGRISDAAKALGIQRTNLYRKMRALKIAHGRE